MSIKKVKKKIKQLMVKNALPLYSKVNHVRIKKKMEERYSRINNDAITVYTLGPVEITNNYKFGSLSKLIEPADFSITALEVYQENIIKPLKESGIKAICISNGLPAECDEECIVPRNSYRIFENNNMKIAVLYYDADVDYHQISDVIRILDKDSTYVLAYIFYDSFTEDVDNLMKKLGRSCNQVVGYGHNEDSIFDVKSSKVLQSIGTFGKKNYNTEIDLECIILKNVVKKYNNKIVDVENCFIPCVFDTFGNIVRKVDPSIKSDLSIYRSLNKKIRNISDEDRILDLNDLFTLFGLEVPAKYEYLKSVIVNKICVTPNEIDKLSVIFVREYDEIIHGYNLKITPEEHYKRTISSLRKNAEKGLVFAFSPIDLPVEIPHIKVESTMKLHAKICKHIIDSCHFDIKVAVTGSIGKTSTKEMVSLVLSQKYNTLKNNGNENLQVQMGLMLKELNPRYEAYVQEVGGGRVGRASEFSKVLTPDIGIVTNIGYSHLRMSKTREQLAINKIGISDGIRNNGPLFVNLDNDILQKTDLSNRNVVTYAINHEEADYKAENIIVESDRVLFDIVHLGKSTACVINTPGKYNIYNALVAFGIGQYAGIDEKKICEGIAKFKPEGIRQTLAHYGNYHLFVDCFNAAPDSMVGAVEALSQMGDGSSRKIAVLADMTGYEELSANLHKEVGEKITKFDIDYLICYGTDIVHVYDNMTNRNVIKIHCPTKKDVIDALQSIIKPGDYILFKGSSKFKMEEEIVDAIWGTNFTTLVPQIRTRKLIQKRESGEYQLFKSCGHLIAAKNVSIFKMASNSNNRPIVSISRNVFENNSKLKSIVFSDNLRSIQHGAFKNCTELMEIILPGKMQIIEDNAFEGCASLTKVHLNDSLIHVGSQAFKNCSMLTEVIMNDKISFIGDDAFEGCPKVSLICSPGSYSEKYAKNHGMKISYCKDEE